MEIEVAQTWHAVDETHYLDFGQPVRELAACLMVFANYADKEESYKANWQLSKAATFWRICALLWPKTDTSKVHVEPNPWAERMIDAACKYKVLSCAGCASSGKSFLLGATWGIVNWLCAPTETIVLITSTSIQGSRKRVWKDVMRLFQSAGGVGLDKCFCPAFKLSEATAQIKINPMILGKVMGGLNGLAVGGMGIEIVAGEASQSADACKKIQGIKAKRMFLIGDEFANLGHSILETALGNLTANKHSQLIALANFDSIYDPFGVISEPVLGWKSIHEGIEGWDTCAMGQPGYCLRFDGDKSPNVLAGENIYDGLYSVEANQKHKAMGEKSKAYWKYCKAMPMPEGDDLSIYSEADFVSGDSHGNVVWTGTTERVAFLDPAFTNGGDRSYLSVGDLGMVNDRKVFKFLKGYELQSDVTQIAIPHDFQIARQFRDKCKELGISPRNAGFDSTGGGISFGSIVFQEWSPLVLPICFGGAASDLPVSLVDDERCSERYHNRVSEIWVQGREYVRSGQIKGMSKSMARELLARRFPDTAKTKISNRKIKIEGKDEMKRRFGCSPDEADSGLGVLEVARQRLEFTPFGFGTAMVGRKEEASESDKAANEVWDDESLLEEPEFD